MAHHSRWAGISRIWQLVVHAKNVFLSRSTPLWLKLSLGLGLLYILSPLDGIPEWVPFLGILDDFTLAALLLSVAARFQDNK